MKKQRHYFADKCPSSQSHGFCSSHVWMWELEYKENWVLKNWCFWTGCWRRLLKVPWTARRSSQSILKEISPEYSLDGLMLKLKIQYYVYLIQRTDSLEKTLMLGKIKGRRRRGRHKMRWLDSITNSMDMSLSKLQELWWTEKPGMFQSMESDMTELLGWTELNMQLNYHCGFYFPLCSLDFIAFTVTVYEAVTRK